MFHYSEGSPFFNRTTVDAVREKPRLPRLQKDRQVSLQLGGRNWRLWIHGHWTEEK